MQFDYCLVFLCLGNLVLKGLACTVTITHNWTTLENEIPGFRYFFKRNCISYSCLPRLIDLPAPNRILCMYLNKAVAHSGCALHMYICRWIHQIKICFKRVRWSFKKYVDNIAVECIKQKWKKIQNLKINNCEIWNHIFDRQGMFINFVLQYLSWSIATEHSSSKTRHRGAAYIFSKVLFYISHTSLSSYQFPRIICPLFFSLFRKRIIGLKIILKPCQILLICPICCRKENKKFT